MSQGVVRATLWPLDRVRARILRQFKVLLRPLVVDRELRVALTGVLLVAAAFVGALALPLWMLALGPIVWGIPHVLADVRYLVVRPGHHRRPWLVGLVGVPLLVVAVGGGVVAGLVGAGGALIAARCDGRRRAAGLAVVVVGVAGALSLGPAADLIFAHIHNFIAVGLWWAWRRRAGRAHGWPLAIYVAGVVALGLGIGDGLVGSTLSAGWALGGMDGVWFAESLAPGLPSGWAARLVILFAFAQAVHYGVWVRLVPEEDRPQRTPRSFLASYRALESDFGPWPLALVGLGCVALAIWAVVDLAEARTGYLRMAIFHGHLELAAAALLFAEGRPLSADEGADPGAGHGRPPGRPPSAGEGCRVVGSEGEEGG